MPIFELKKVKCLDCKTIYFGNVENGTITTTCPMCEDDKNLILFGNMHPKPKDDKNPSGHYAGLKIKSIDDEEIESKIVVFNCECGTSYCGDYKNNKIMTPCPTCTSKTRIKTIDESCSIDIKPPPGKNPSGHYAQLDIKPIDVAEQRISTGFSTIGNVGNWHLATAIEYLMRAGLKSGQPWRKDVQKALDHGYRAIHGHWPWDSEQ